MVLQNLAFWVQWRHQSDGDPLQAEVGVVAPWLQPYVNYSRTSSTIILLMDIEEMKSF